MRTPVVVFAQDTDMLILLLYHRPDSFTNLSLLLVMGGSSIRISDPKNIYSIMLDQPMTLYHLSKDSLSVPKNVYSIMQDQTMTLYHKLQRSKTSLVRPFRTEDTVTEVLCGA